MVAIGDEEAVEAEKDAAVMAVAITAGTPGGDTPAPLAVLLGVGGGRRWSPSELRRLRPSEGEGQAPVGCRNYGTTTGTGAALTIGDDSLAAAAGVDTASNRDRHCRGRGSRPRRQRADRTASMPNCWAGLSHHSLIVKGGLQCFYYIEMTDLSRSLVFSLTLKNYIHRYM